MSHRPIHASIYRFNQEGDLCQQLADIKTKNYDNYPCYDLTADTEKANQIQSDICKQSKQGCTRCIFNNIYR